MFSKKIIDDIRNRAKKDLFFFAKHILNYDKLTDVHKEWALELEDLSCKRRLDLEPRGTYKSTLRTVAYSLWRLINDHNIRILIVNATHNGGSGFLREIKSHISRNELFKTIFGEWYNKDKWTETGILIKPRTSHKKDMSVVSSGIGGNITGKHFDIIICDDIVNDKDRDFESAREKTLLFYEELSSILEPDGWMFLIGTRWHFFDLYSYIIDNINPSLKQKKLPTYKIKVQSAINEDGSLQFPDILTAEKLEQLKLEKGLQFHSQYLNNPLPEGQALFPESKINFFDWKDINIDDLSTFGFIDPAIGESSNASRTAIIIIGKSDEGHLYVIDVFIDRIDPDKALDKIFKYNQKWKFTRFGYETNMHLSYWYKKLVKKNQQTNTFIPIVGIQQKMKKETRIEGLEPLIADGTIKFRRDYKSFKMYDELIKEMLFYPRGKTVDGIDALESCVRVARALMAAPKINIEVQSMATDWNNIE